MFQFRRWQQEYLATDFLGYKYFTSEKRAHTFEQTVAQLFSYAFHSTYLHNMRTYAHYSTQHNSCAPALRILKQDFIKN